MNDNLKSIVTTAFVTALLICSVQSSHAKESDTIPLTFTSGKWISAQNLEAEKAICSGQEIQTDEDFYIQFKSNSYSAYGWEWEEHAQVIALSDSSPTVLKGKVKETAQWMEDQTIRDKKIDFFIKDGRLYSKTYGDKVKKDGMHHCI